MRLSNVLPLALLVATASLAAAQPIDRYILAYVYPVHPHGTSNHFMTVSSRADDDASLMARELASVDLIARDLSAALIARMDRPERSHFKTEEEYDKAWRAWNRRMGKLSDAMQHTMQKHDPGERPEREHFSSYAEYSKAWDQWNRNSRKVSTSLKKAVDKHVAKGEKEQHKIVHTAAEKKKPGFFSKLTGKGKKKSRRELMYALDG